MHSLDIAHATGLDFAPPHDALAETLALEAFTSRSRTAYDGGDADLLRRADVNRR